MTQPTPSAGIGAVLGRFATWLTALMLALRTFPWRTTLATLRTRFREDQLGLTASSLTFTTMVALVPLFTVLLAVFTAFPMFAKLQGVLQTWLIDSLIPDQIGRQVQGYLTQFSTKAARLGWVSFAALVVTAIALVLTIDKTLNRIWRVRRPRRLAQRVLVYWAGITLGPLVLAASLATTSYVISQSLKLVHTLPSGITLLFNSFEVAVLAFGAATMYFYVPNTRVKWSHAWVGGIFVALSFELAKSGLALYLKAVPTYSSVYGAFATLPILLIWVYIAWLIVLLGAVISAYLPSLLAGVQRRGGTPGWQFQLACEVLQVLGEARRSGAAQGVVTGGGDGPATRGSDGPATRGSDGPATRGLSALAIAERLRVDPLQLENALETLTSLDWIAPLAEEASRYVLLCETSSMPLEPLAAALLLADGDLRQKIVKNTNMSNI